MMISANIIIITMPAIKPVPARIKKIYVKMKIRCKITTPPTLFAKQVNFFNPIAFNVAFLYPLKTSKKCKVS